MMVAEKRRSAALRIGQIACLALWALVALFLLIPRGGLWAVYSAEAPDGAFVPLFSRVDPELNFATPHRLVSPFFQHWNLKTLGVPEKLPPFQVHWTGRLRCPVGGTYLFRVEAAGRVRFLLDGGSLALDSDAAEGVARIPLVAGWHTLDLTYRREDDPPLFRLFWQPPGAASLVVIPRRALSPSAAAAAVAAPRLLCGWVLLAGFVAWVGRLWHHRRRADSLGNFVVARRHGVALSAILLLAFFLRMHEYDLIPFHNETADEYQHGWEGWTLLHEGAPAAWTFYPRFYPPSRVVHFAWFGNPYNLARPYFDHPPGYSLLIGAVSSMLGAEELLDCTLWRMRLVPIFLGLLTVYLVARAGWRLLPFPLAGTLGALLYATLPIVVLGNRLVKAESLLAPILLVQSLWLDRYFREGRKADRFRIAAGAVVAIWAKATGVAVPAVSLLLFAMARRWKEFLLLLAVSVAAGVAYLLYGAFFGWDIFIMILRLQASKGVGIRSALDLAGISRIVELQFGGGWYLWLLLAAGWMALGKWREILVPLGVYFAILVLTADERAVYGWYRLPLYPYLCLAGGLLLCDWWREKDVARGFLFAVTALSSTLQYVLPLSLERTRAAVLLLFALACLAPLWERFRPSPIASRLRSWSVALCLAVFFAGNVAIVIRQLPIYLEQRSASDWPRPSGLLP